MTGLLTKTHRVVANCMTRWLYIPKSDGIVRHTVVGDLGTSSCGLWLGQFKLVLGQDRK